MSLALLALSALLASRHQRATVRCGGRERAIVSLRGYPLTVAFGGATGVQRLRESSDLSGGLSVDGFWKEFLSKSVKAKEPFDWANPRMIIDLEGGTTIVVDQNGRIVVTPRSVENLKAWRGPVRELTGPQVLQLFRETAGLFAARPGG